MQKFQLIATNPLRIVSIFNHILLSLCLLIEIIIFSGCRGTAPQPPVVEFDSPGIKKVLVLPFKNMSQLYGENASLRSPISGKVFVTDKVQDGAEDLMTRLLINGISNLAPYELIPPEQAEGISVSNQIKKPIKQDEKKQIPLIGRHLGADVVLVGHLYRFKERVGSKYAIDSPASVGFDINMVDTRNGKLIWSGYFDETQQSLSENLFLIGTFFKRGGTWVTAKQMASEALDDLVQDMPLPHLDP
jgi:hypothetical protein